jgi:hypothetical protein
VLHSKQLQVPLTVYQNDGEPSGVDCGKHRPETGRRFGGADSEDVVIEQPPREPGQ